MNPQAPATGYVFLNDMKKHTSTESSKLFLRIVSVNGSAYNAVINLAGKWVKILCVYIVF